MATLGIGCRDQLLARHFGIVAGRDDSRDVRRTQVRGETIAAQHQRVALCQRLLREVGTDRAVGAERLQDDVAALADLGLVRGHLSRLDQLLHQRLILGDLQRHAIANDVRATVAHLRQVQRVAEQSGDRRRRAHARMLGVRASEGENAVIRGVGRVADRLDESVGLASGLLHPLRTERVEHRLDGHGTRNLTRRSATHAVGHHQHHSAMPYVDHAAAHLVL